MQDHWWQCDTGEIMLLMYCTAIGFLWGMFALIFAVQHEPWYPTFDLSGLLRAGLLWPVWAALGIGWALHTIGLIGVERSGQIIFSGTPFISALGGALVGSFLIWRLRMPLS